MSQGDTILLDVREPKEIEELGGCEGAINIPITQLEKRLAELPKDKTILTA
jgi:rhodanese-related sulfurtransferase